MEVIILWWCAANLRRRRRRKKCVSTSAAFVTTEFQVGSVLHIASHRQTKRGKECKTPGYFALTLSIYYGYIVQANSLRANRHIVLNTETKDTFLRWREKSGQTERWDTTGGNRDSTGGDKTAKTPPLPSGGWVTNSTSFVLDIVWTFLVFPK